MGHQAAREPSLRYEAGARRELRVWPGGTVDVVFHDREGFL